MKENITELKERIRIHVNPNARLTAVKLEAALNELEMLRDNRTVYLVFHEEHGVKHLLSIHANRHDAVSAGDKAAKEHFKMLEEINETWQQKKNSWCIEEWKVE